MVRDTTLAHKGLAPYKLISYFYVGKDAHAGHTQCISGIKTTAYTRPLPFIRKKPTAQIAHLVFSITQSNPKKPKELFFPTAQRLLISLTD